jgi:hypothetical protein
MLAIWPQRENISGKDFMSRTLSRLSFPITKDKRVNLSTSFSKEAFRFT